MFEIVGIGWVFLCRFSLGFLMILCDISIGYVVMVVIVVVVMLVKLLE